MRLIIKTTTIIITVITKIIIPHAEEKLKYFLNIFKNFVSFI